MKGFIKIFAEPSTPEGKECTALRAECKLEHVSLMDKLAIVEAVAKSLEMNPMDLILAAQYCIDKPYEGVEVHLP